SHAPWHGAFPPQRHPLVLKHDAGVTRILASLDLPSDHPGGADQRLLLDHQTLTLLGGVFPAGGLRTGLKRLSLMGARNCYQKAGRQGGPEENDPQVPRTEYQAHDYPPLMLFLVLCVGVDGRNDSKRPFVNGECRRMSWKSFRSFGIILGLFWRP